MEGTVVKYLRIAPENNEKVGQNGDRHGLEMKSSPLKSYFILFYLWFVYKRHQ
jgi:hypothetical protein